MDDTHSLPLVTATLRCLLLTAACHKAPV